MKKEQDTNLCILKSEDVISFENQTFYYNKEIAEKISIGIFINKGDLQVKLRLILQSYGFFVRILKNQDEVINAANENLIQLLIISPENETDEALSLCKNIQKSNSLSNNQDLTILAIVDKFHSYFIEKLEEYNINEFITKPFDVSELLFRIQKIENFRNINKKKQQLLKSEHEKSLFLYFVTHNVNTPLTLLLNEIQKLSEIQEEISLQNEKKEELKNSIEVIQKNTKAINTIIQNVLDSYKISEKRYIINPKILNLKNSIKTETESLYKKAKNKNQNFTFNCTVKSPCIFCDEYSLKGIYENIVDNAIKYTNPNGNISVLIEEDNNFIILNVIDDGPGIPKEKQGLLFSKFAKIGSIPTGNEKSLGLGLFVVNEICKLNGLILEYSDNKTSKSGSIFSVKFKKID